MFNILGISGRGFVSKNPKFHKKHPTVLRVWEGGLYKKTLNFGTNPLLDYPKGGNKTHTKPQTCKR
ncbi:hypothetical protein, partial [Gardnerella vaginalis]|uniref:hypothetical protein n=1 Tax=Gardnerella vaginalis TaxID=2702 RepID=UPI001F418CCB